VAVHTSGPSIQIEAFEWRGGELLPGIRVKEGESFESALRRFKKKCEKAGILADLRRHQHFEKPSERRKRKLNAAKRKNLARRQEN
jgi:small subunit ribosomal protein S21